ncbi:MAG TPA: META domain-containing protein [Actinomycetota bacterium]|nr:META domain-containing protein [Actinomycetota bacterium]
MRLRLIAIVLPLVLVASAFSACGGDDGGSGGGGSQDPAALEGESWILTQMLTAGGQTQILDVGVSASFDGTTISGNAGCNSYHASYEASGGEISFGPIAATQMACPEAQMSTEDRYLQLLAEIGSYEVSGRSMSMNDTDGTPVLQFMQG